MRILSFNLFRLAVKTVSELTFIKHNLILERPELFNFGRQQAIEESADEIVNQITADDIIIEDC